MDYNRDNSTLIKSDDILGYFIITKDRYVALIEDNDLAKKIIDKLLNDGAEVYATQEDYDKKYLVEILNFEEQKERSMEAWEDIIPEEQWTDEVRNAILKKRERLNKSK